MAGKNLRKESSYASECVHSKPEYKSSPKWHCTASRLIKKYYYAQQIKEIGT